MLLVGCQKNKYENGIGAGKSGDCWCTDGQAKALGIKSYPNANKWTAKTLAPAGNYYLADKPSLNDIAVFDSFYHSNAIEGHVARVKEVIVEPNGYKITFWGTNQTSDAKKWKVSCGCNNFSDWTFIVYNTEILSGKIKFFHISKSNLICGDIFTGEVVDDRQLYIPTSIESHSTISSFNCADVNYDGNVLKSEIANVDNKTGAITFRVSRKDGMTFKSSGRILIRTGNKCGDDIKVANFYADNSFAELTYVPTEYERKGTIYYYVDAKQTSGTYVGCMYGCGWFILKY